MIEKKFSVAGRLQSFVYAWQGIKKAFSMEHNTWIHLASTIAIAALGFLYQINKLEWCLLIGVVAAVWSAELFNTTIEKTIDFVSTERHPQIKMIKDIAAAAVLISSAAALIIGCIIFFPKIF